MKPTLMNPYKWPRAQSNINQLKELLGREPHEGDFIGLECVWAGQPGHEKCGWCLLCKKPRSMKGCTHPEEYIWKNP